MKAAIADALTGAGLLTSGMEEMSMGRSPVPVAQNLQRIEGKARASAGSARASTLHEA